MPTNVPIQDFLPQPIVDRIEQFRRERKLGSVRDALIVALAEFFDQPNEQSPNQANSQADSTANLNDRSSDLAALQSRLYQMEVMLLGLTRKIEQIEQRQPLPSAPVPVLPIAEEDDDIEDEPDEILYSFLQSPELEQQMYELSSQTIQLTGRSGGTISIDPHAQPLTYEDFENEPDEILYDFLDPES